MTTNPTLEIKNYGQSIWMDYLDRGLIESGELREKTENRGVRGVTSNPKTFSSAVSNSNIYNADIEAGIKAGKSTSEIYESLIIEDIRNACDVLRPIYDESDGNDGFISIEVSPHLARDTQGTLEEARKFFQAVDRDNVLIKIPGTKEGFPAIEQAISEGINVNVTLLFSIDSYTEAAWAYIRGLEQRVERGEPIDKIASVASFFLSRIDTKVDERIDARIKEIGTENLSEEARLQDLRGKIAIANAKVAYHKFKEILDSDRWKALAQKGANVQRVLWASTSTKDPRYSDVRYIDALVGEHTINTLPPKTIEACADHCDVAPNRVEEGVDEAYKLLESLSDPDINISYDQVMHELIEEGIEKFANPFDELMQSLEEKSKQLSPA
jgi:transaldolase